MTFPDFFQAATGNPPYGYQCRLGCGPQLSGQIPSSLMTRSLPVPLPSMKSSSAMTKSTRAKPKLPSPLPPEQVLRFSWTKLIELIRLDDPWQRAFYENECLRGNWSARQLQRTAHSRWKGSKAR
jgi:hypothetical protein